ncbi:MAG TPA: glucose-6-phosphate dehydrogenase [Longimicrobiaceae bacterium]|nr:glucose-6-phosphate dehydrogenase [Longimicrobiaceae bacterium]
MKASIEWTTDRSDMDAPTSVVIFGASGDLTSRKLVPAIFSLWEAGALPGEWEAVGFGRRPLSDDEFRRSVRPEAVPEGWAEFAAHLHYRHGGYDDPASYEALAEQLDAFDASHGAEPGAGNRLYYLATPPDVFPVVVDRLEEAGLHRGTIGWRRVIVEKPFGRDLESARALNARILQTFREDQVFRIDHYLGKETVQNILAFRLGNGIFEPLWNRNYIDYVQILVAESLGVEGRGGYYDHAGALRDMVQNHLLQLLALVAMEPPGTFTADAVRNEKVKVLQCIRPIAPGEVDRYVVRGQYEGYRDEPGIAPDSTTETYVAMQLAIDTWRWSGVPFFLRTGKALPERRTEICIVFRQPPLTLFAKATPAEQPEGPPGQVEPTVLTLRIQPDEGISLRLGLKPPGAGMRLAPVQLGFSYRSRFGRDAPDAYERLLLDALSGDATLFIRGDEAEAAWTAVTPILEAWASSDRAPEPYPEGSWGPAAADALVKEEHCEWRPGGDAA